jgi:hypothetical protein
MFEVGAWNGPLQFCYWLKWKHEDSLAVQYPSMDSEWGVVLAIATIAEALLTPMSSRRTPSDD